MKFLALNLLFFLSFSLFASDDQKEEMVDEQLAPTEAEFEDLIFKGMENFSVERKNGKVYIGFDYVIENPNKLTIVIKPSSLFLKIADQDCGWVRIEEKIKIKKKSEANYPFMMVGDASNFVKSAFSGIWGLLTGAGIDFNISGKLKAGIAIFKKKWPVDYTYKMSNEEFMSFF
ncbi:MAG: hypothetical protein R2780_06320 [Crocinitomicaceae bacterium]